MACLAGFYIGYMYPQFNFRFDDDALIKKSREVAVLYGKKGLFHGGDNRCDSATLNKLKGLVNAMNEYLQEYIIYLDEVANTGIDWSKKANQGNSYCGLFDQTHLNKLKEAVDSARTGRDNREKDKEIDKLPSNLKCLGNIGKDIRDVVAEFFTTPNPGGDGLYQGNYARLVDEIYRSFAIGSIG